MAEVEIQRKQGGVPAWAWIMGLLVLAGLIWWLVAANTNNRVGTAADNVGPATTAVTTTDNNTDNNMGAMEGAGTDAMTPNVEAANANLPLAAIQENPSAYFNKWVSGMGTVTEVVGDRAFWIEQDGKRMMVVKAENLVESTNIVTGNKVSFSGMVINPSEAADRVPSMDKLEDGTRQTLQSEPAFIQATNIEMQNS